MGGMGCDPDVLQRDLWELNRERVRLEVAGGNYRLVVAFDFRRHAAFVRIIGTLTANMIVSTP